MPLYEYQCQECGETHEMLQRVTDEPYSICPSCGGALKKLISSPAIQFKGSGFYITDYGKGNSGAGSSKSGESRSDSGSSSGTSSSSSSGGGESKS